MSRLERARLERIPLGRECVRSGGMGWPSRQKTNPLGSRNDAPSRPSEVPTPRDGVVQVRAWWQRHPRLWLALLRAPKRPHRASDLRAEEDRDGDQWRDGRLDDQLPRGRCTRGMGTCSTSRLGSGRTGGYRGKGIRITRSMQGSGRSRPEVVDVIVVGPREGREVARAAPKYSRTRP